MKAKNIFRIILIVLLLGVFLFSAWYVIDYYASAAKQKAQYDSLAALVESVRSEAPSNLPSGKADPTGQTTPGPTEFEDTILPEYLPLYQMNSDMVGWLAVPGTRVNYPVMQTPDRTDYYLYRNFNREDSARGCLYARESCDIFTPSDNITIYGHHMADGSMFRDLMQYDSREFYLEHDTFTFDTLHERHTYRIFAVFKTSATEGHGFTYHRFENAENEEDFDRFIAMCKQHSFYDTGYTPEYGGKLICLSTCEYTQENGRFVVVGYRIS